MSGQALAPIIGVSPAIKRATKLMERFAPTALPILLIGATGTGKELFARHIHQASKRPGELIDINCGALPQEIADSLLFGHRRGAFTGAVDSVVGHLQRADEGTLFLDEVLQLSSLSQVKLLRALETGEVQPVGAGNKRRVDFRIIAAAQQDTSERLSHGAFRHDLFQRLAGVIINLPALNERPEDIVPLARHFAEIKGQQLDSRAADILEDHPWPGNVRELRLTIERAGCLVPNGSLPAAAVRDAIALGMVQLDRQERRASERRQRGADRRGTIVGRLAFEDLLAQCTAHNCNAARVAQSLGIAQSTLYNRLKAAGISLRALRAAGERHAEPPNKGSNEA